MTGGQKVLFAIGVVLILVAVVLAVKTRPPPPEPSFCDANRFPSTWGYDPATTLQFTMTVLPASAADRSCDVTFTWTSGKITTGYVGKDGFLYMQYAPDRPVRKHRIINNSRFAELADDGTVSNYKVKIA